MNARVLKYEKKRKLGENKQKINHIFGGRGGVRRKAGEVKKEMNKNAKKN